MSEVVAAAWVALAAFLMAAFFCFQTSFFCCFLDIPVVALGGGSGGVGGVGGGSGGDGDGDGGGGGLVDVLASLLVDGEVWGGVGGAASCASNALPTERSSSNWKSESW